MSRAPSRKRFACRPAATETTRASVLAAAAPGCASRSSVFLAAPAAPAAPADRTTRSSLVDVDRRAAENDVDVAVQVGLEHRAADRAGGDLGRRAGGGVLVVVPAAARVA